MALSPDWSTPGGWRLSNFGKLETHSSAPLLHKSIHLRLITLKIQLLTEEDSVSLFQSNFICFWV